MFDTTPSPGPEATDVADLDEWADPIASVVAIDVSRQFVRWCLGGMEQMVGELASQERTLAKPGGIELATRLMAQRFYRRIDADVFRLLGVCVPLSHAAAALSAVEDVLRARFGDVVESAASFLMSDDRDVAIQMAAVATTMAGREVRAAVAEIIASNRRDDPSARSQVADGA